MSEQATYLTEDGVQKLQAELEELKTVRRPAVIRRIKEAISYGDLSENSEYDDAKNEQAFVEGRIVELEKTLQHSEVVSKSGHGGTVSVGSTVKVKHHGSNSSFMIVGAAEADPDQGKISNESPLGQGLLGKQTGDDAVVTTPKGETTYTITAVA